MPAISEDLAALAAQMPSSASDVVEAANERLPASGQAPGIPLRFPVLSDVDQSTIAADRHEYRVSGRMQDLLPNSSGHDLRERNADRSWTLPVAATFVVDRRGIVRARHVEADFTRRMEPGDVLAALSGPSR